MNDNDIPILKKSYDLYKTLYTYRKTVSKQDKYTTWQQCENLALYIIEQLFLASQLPKNEKIPLLEQTSLKLSFLKVLIRLIKEVKVIDLKKYAAIQENLDEIGRMLGGWLKNTKSM